jgi:hypothetical protein
MAWYRLTLTCDGVPPSAGGKAAIDITDSFRKRPWHRTANCAWDGESLILTAENDFDPDGRALMDEFADEISASIVGGFDGDLHVVSAVEVS